MPPQPPTPKLPLTQDLLTRSHSPTTSARIHADKFAHKPLPLLPTTDARTERQTQRATKLSTKKRRKAKANSGPLSAATKRARRIYAIPRSETRYELYLGLHRLWAGYMREILGIIASIPANLPITTTTTNDNSTTQPNRSVTPNPVAKPAAAIPEPEGKPTAPATPRAYITAASHGATLASADLHGARLRVVRSRCAGRVGVDGIVVREGKMSFLLVTRGDRVITIPKEHTVFEVEVPIAEEAGAGVAGGVGTVGGPRPLVFELYGEQFKSRAADRASKKFKMHISPDL